MQLNSYNSTCKLLFIMETTYFICCAIICLLRGNEVATDAPPKMAPLVHMKVIKPKEAGVKGSILPQLVNPTTIDSYPYQVALLADGKLICSGALLADKRVITAASCTAGLSATILSIRVGSSFHIEGGQVITIEEILQHPDYKADTFDNDLAILKLTKPVDFGPTVDIAQIFIVRQDHGANTQCAATGWGLQSDGDKPSMQLQVAQISIVDRAECRTFYDSSITDSMICAGRFESGKGPCRNNGGGPLTVDKSLVGIQTGKVGKLGGCDKPGHPEVYAKIANYQEWIYANLR